jgi:hypothetical protein
MSIQPALNREKRGIHPGWKTHLTTSSGVKTVEPRDVLVATQSSSPIHNSEVAGHYRGRNRRSPAKIDSPQRKQLGKQKTVMRLHLDLLPLDPECDGLRGASSSLVLEPSLRLLCPVDSHGEFQRSIQPVASKRGHPLEGSRLPTCVLAQKVSQHCA